MAKSPAAILFDSSGNAIGVTLDGTIYRLETVGKILDSSGYQINPSSEDTLASIKDTDGIKKITDAVAVTDNGGSLTVDGPLTDAELRASAVPISAASLPLPTGASTEATLSSILTDTGQIEALLTTIDADTSNLDVALSTRASETTLASIKDTDGIKKITDPLPAGTNEIGKVAQGTKAAAADGWPQVLYDASGNPVGVLQDGALYRLQTSNTFTEDAAKLVGVNFGQTGVTATTYYVFIDLNGASYKHSAGTKVIAAGAGGKAVKSNSGAKWSVSLMVVLRIDGTDADLGVLPIASVSLLDTSLFYGSSQVVLFPAVTDLEVSAGDFTKITDGMTESNVAAVNTGVTFKDVLGNDVTPAVGDVLLRATLVSGGGTLDFVYGMDYWVE
jgi:hypothetical protein